MRDRKRRTISPGQLGIGATLPGRLCILPTLICAGPQTDPVLSRWLDQRLPDVLSKLNYPTILRSCDSSLGGGRKPDLRFTGHCSDLKIKKFTRKKIPLKFLFVLVYTLGENVWILFWSGVSRWWLYRWKDPTFAVRMQNHIADTMKGGFVKGKYFSIDSYRKEVL